MSVQQFGKKFPILLRTPSPRGQVELIETIGKGNYGYVYKVTSMYTERLYYQRDRKRGREKGKRERELREKKGMYNIHTHGIQI
jgi:hypothetical protein